VQGVGFRPFIYQLARKNGLTGWVCNTSGDVTMVVEGQQGCIDQFMTELRANPPPQSHIESITEEFEPTGNYPQFEILKSLVKNEEYQLISPDLATCVDCQKEIFDPANRRYRYPFTNCTNCGPRFTIIEDIPYDRSRTTMRHFQMCPECKKEYDDVENRRFHAQPNVCPVCGPRLELTDSKGVPVSVKDVIAASARLISAGKIIAIKGLGGFLLACDATNDKIVRLLRERKQRPDKPLAVMVKNVVEARRICQINRQEEELLNSPAGQIVLLKMKSTSIIASEVAPGLKHLGMMLPYTPLHHLLMNEAMTPLVMTSGNISEEPIAKDNSEALARLGSIADYFVLHNRNIYSRYDDSVVMAEQDSVSIIRRARGQAPYPIKLPFQSRLLLACGADMKNTFCLTRNNHAFISQHIGDMENAETLEHFESTLGQYKKLFRIEPEMIACDLHPDYLSTQWAVNEAKKTNLPLIKVQHHYAHILSCMADNEVLGPVIGIALDGTGYGTDGHIWGSEFMIADYQGYQRKAHLEYLPVPGGNAAINRPYRTAAGYLYSLAGPETLEMDLPCFKDIERTEIAVIRQQIDHKLNSPLTSSCGRLFDAVSALIGVKQRVSYEGQAAMELEEIADENVRDKLYPYNIETCAGIDIIRLKALFLALIADYQKGVPAAVISAIFHNTVVRIICETASKLSRETDIKDVALSGGVFQNRRILNQVSLELKKMNLRPLIHKRTPCNDAGISLGQAAAANMIEGRN